jgi:hypothetical protein
MSLPLAHVRYRVPISRDSCFDRLETMDYREEVAYLQTYEGFRHRQQFSSQPWIAATAMAKKSGDICLNFHLSLMTHGMTVLAAHKADLMAFMEKLKAERKAPRMQ